MDKRLIYSKMYFILSGFYRRKVILKMHEISTLGDGEMRCTKIKWITCIHIIFFDATYYG